MSLAIGCGSKDAGNAKATETDCRAVSEHIADLIIADRMKDPSAFFDAVKGGPGGAESGIPATVTRDAFKAWLDSPEGKTWMLQRRGQTLAGTQEGIGRCMERATKADTKCFIAAKSKEDVNKCDAQAAARAGKGTKSTGGAPAGAIDTGSAGSAPPATPQSGSATGSATDEKQAVPPPQ